MNFKIFGIPVKVDGSFFLLTILLAASGGRELPLLVEWILVVFFSILIHELGHAFMGRLFGLTPNITLYSMGGLTSFGQAKSITPLKEILISLAGPFSGFLFGGIILLLTTLLSNGDLSRPVSITLRDLLWVNFGWGIFNLLPILPLDGGQVVGNLERWVRGKKDGRITYLISFLFAITILLLALYLHTLWIALMAGWFAMSNGSVLIQGVRLRQDQSLQSSLDQAREEFKQNNVEAAAELSRSVFNRAKTDPVKRQALELLIHSLIHAEKFEEAREELNRYQAFFGRNQYLEGSFLYYKGDLEQAVQSLGEAFKTEPAIRTGRMLFMALIETGHFDEALHLCSHPALERVATALYTELQTQANRAGRFDISAKAAQLANE